MEIDVILTPRTNLLNGIQEAWKLWQSRKWTYSFRSFRRPLNWICNLWKFPALKFCIQCEYYLQHSHVGFTLRFDKNENFRKYDRMSCAKFAQPEAPQLKQIRWKHEASILIVLFMTWVWIEKICRFDRLNSLCL